MTKPPFEVPIWVEPAVRGVYDLRPIATGYFLIEGRSVRVSLGMQSLHSPPGEESPEEPLRFGVRVADQFVSIDVTHMLERIAREFHRLGDQPPKTLRLGSESRR
jgi:hypothetical protein